MGWIPIRVKTWKYGMWGEMEEYWSSEDEVYGPLMNDLLVLLYTL